MVARSSKMISSDTIHPTNTKFLSPMRTRADCSRELLEQEGSRIWHGCTALAWVDMLRAAPYEAREKSGW